MPYNLCKKPSSQLLIVHGIRRRRRRPHADGPPNLLDEPIAHALYSAAVARRQRLELAEPALDGAGGQDPAVLVDGRGESGNEEVPVVHELGPEVGRERVVDVGSVGGRVGVRRGGGGEHVLQPTDGRRQSGQEGKRRRRVQGLAAGGAFGGRERRAKDG